MSAVVLNRHLMLEERMDAPDGAGGFVSGWVERGRLWGDLRPRTGREAAGEDVALSRLAFRVTLRAAPIGAASRPVAGQRFHMGVRVFGIDAVRELAPGAAYLICDVREEVAK